MSSNPQPSEILRAAAKHAPVVLPAPLGDAAAAWLLAEANCHESVHEVGSTFVGMVDSIASNRGSPTRYSVAISTVNTAVEFARAILATPQASSAERDIEKVAQVLRDCKKVVRDEQDYEVFCAKRVLAALNGIEASR